MFSKGRQQTGFKALLHERLVPETGIEPVRPFSGKRRILSPLCLPISPLGQYVGLRRYVSKKSAGALSKKLEAGIGVEPI
jgi:hypothetical protein